MSNQGDMEKLVAQNQGTPAMDVIGSLHKIAKEIVSVDENTDPNEYLDRIGAASWLLEYIADGLAIELQHAQERGNLLALKKLEEGDLDPR